MTAQTNGERLLELARDLSVGFVDAEEQRELGRLLYDAALWPNNPLAKLSPVGAKQAREIDDSLELLRLLLEERSHRTDGGMLDLVGRCLHLSRGDRDLISLRGKIIKRLEARHPIQPLPVITPEMWKAGRRAYADWVMLAYGEGKPTDEQCEEGVRIAIAAMKLEAPSGSQGIDLGQKLRALELMRGVARTLVDWAADDQREAIKIIEAMSGQRDAAPGVSA